MSLESNKNGLYFLLASLGLITLPHINHVPYPVFGFFYLLLTWRMLAIRIPACLPGFNLTFVLTLSGMALLFIQYDDLFGRQAVPSQSGFGPPRIFDREASTSLLMTALALKLMELRKNKDVSLATHLTFVVAATQFLYQQSLIMLAYIFLVIILLLAAMVNQASRSITTVASIRIATVLALQAIPIALAIFILFPRIEAPRLQWFSDRNTRLSSLSDFLEPGSISNLSLSEELVFRVKFSERIPPPEFRYWRGPVMTHTDGRRWTQSVTEASEQAVAEPSVSGGLYQYVIMMEPQAKNWVFAMDMPVNYSGPLTRNAYYQLTTSQSPERRSEYRIDSYPLYNTGIISDDQRRESLQLPFEPSDRVKSLIRQLHGYDGRPEVFIGELLRHFREENFRYTLTPPKLDDDPIETFLFETRSGFCSHYASAFVYLMRAANIPSRIVSGFLGGTYNSVGQFLEIRQKDAHAWAEVWLRNKGWVRYDPTAAIAPERIESSYDIDDTVLGGEIFFETGGAVGGLVVQWLDQARLLMNSADYNWQRWVINYNSLNQSRVLGRFGIHDAKSMVMWMTLIIGVIIAILGSYLLFYKKNSADKALKSYRRFCNKLRSGGLSRGLSEGARDFALRAKTTIPERSEEIDRITELFIGLRYGREPKAEDLKQLSRLVSIFKL